MTVRPHPRTPNLALRRIRQSLRMSQAQFAAAILAAGEAMGEPNHATKRLVQKWETGEHAACRPNYVKALMAVTGCSASELGFSVELDDSGTMPAGNQTNGDAVTQSTMSQITKYSDATVEKSLARLNRAVNDPSLVDSRSAKFAEHATVRLFGLERHSSARLLTPSVERHLVTTTILLSAARHEAVRGMLTNTSGRTALLAGWLAFDRGDVRSADDFWGAAVSAAQSTVDHGLLAASLVYQSYAAARRGDADGAWELAHDASVLTPDDDRATAWSTARVARCAALAGDRQEATKAAHRALEVELPKPTPGDSCQPWLRFFDHASLLASIALTAALTGDAAADDYARRAVDALSPAKTKARAVVLAELALTAAIVGDRKTCREHGITAAALARDLQVSVAFDLLHEVMNHVLHFSDERSVRELLPHISSLTRTPDMAQQFENDDTRQQDSDEDAEDDEEHEGDPEQMRLEFEQTAADERDCSQRSQETAE